MLSLHRKNNNTMGRYFKLDTEAMLKDLAQGTLKKAKEIGSLIQEEVVELKKEFEETVKEYQEEQNVSQSDTNETGDMTTITIPTKLCKKLQYLALIPDPENPYSNCRTYNEGKSDYSKHLIQTWTIWQDYPELDPWQKDIIKRTLRIKTKEDEILDTKKIIHICNERLRQLEYEK